MAALTPWDAELLDPANVAWVLASAALVMFMTPGLAFFYGGMVRAKNVLTMLMQNFFSLGLVSVLWVVIAYSLAFGGNGRFIGNLDFAWMQNPLAAPIGLEALTIPSGLYMVYQLMFAIITPALITGAIADRVKFSAWVWFLGLWLLMVYSPVARSCTSTPESRPWPWCSWSESGGGGRGTRCSRTRSR